jgi:Na+/melibiose symporter-like transporter
MDCQQLVKPSFVSSGISQTMDIQAVFPFSTIPGIIAVVILVFFVKEVAIKKPTSTTTIFGNMGKIAKGNKQFVILLIVTGMFSLGLFNFSFVFFKVSDLGVDPSAIPIIYAVINVAHAIIGITPGILADKTGKEKALTMGCAVFLAVTSLLMALLADNSLYAYVLASGFELYLWISETAQRAFIPKHVPAKLRGTAYGLYNHVSGVC